MLKSPTIHRPGIKFQGEPITFQNQVYPTYVPAEKEENIPFETQPIYVPEVTKTEGVYVPAVTRTNIPPQYYSGCGRKHYGAGTIMGLSYGTMIILALAAGYVFITSRKVQSSVNYAAPTDKDGVIDDEEVPEFVLE